MTYRDPNFQQLAAFTQHLEIAETLWAESTDADWFGMWDQLASARQIARAYGRDTNDHDRARARALASAMGTGSARAAADLAILALRSAFPEVAAPTPRMPRRAPPPLIAVDRSGSTGSRVETHEITLRARANRSFWSSTAPTARFPPRCVCCNAATNLELAYHTKSDRDHHAPILRVPSCDECKDHVGHAALTDWVAFFAVVGVVALVIGIAAAQPAGFLTSGFALLAWGFMRMQQRHIQQHLYRNGHHPLFSVTMMPDQLVLTTSNATLADDFERENRLHGL